MMKGMSRVLFMIRACLRYSPLDMNNVEPMWRVPMIMKNRIETFFMFWIVSIGGIIQEEGIFGSVAGRGFGFPWDFPGEKFTGWGLQVGPFPRGKVWLLPLESHDFLRT